MKNDSELYSDIMGRLEYEPSVDATHITVAVHEGVVTLNGTVPSHTQKRAAKRAIKNIRGIKAVANELKVDLLESLKRSDVDIAKAAVAALEWHSDVPEDAIKVTVANGSVTLSGEVAWWHQRKSAENAVRDLRGVTSVNNNITIRPVITVTPAHIKERITQAFERHAQLDAQSIQVEVVDGKALLKGTVRSWAEATEAIRAAWSTPGVTAVEDQLVVSF